MAMPAEYDIEVYIGDSLTLTFTWDDDDGDPIDMSGQTVAHHIRATAGGALLYDWSSSWDTTSAASGVLVLAPTAAVTGAMEGGVYVHDVQLTNGSTVTTWMEGQVNATLDVTRT